MKDRTKKMLGGLAMAAVLVCGCSTKKMTSTDVPSTAMTEAKATKGKLEHYRVKKHDTLWAIAAKKSVYGDAFEWPLLFKANRDKIQDPDLIYPKQTFKIETQVDPLDVKNAEKAASETPKYVPHDKPQKPSSVDYF